MKEFETTGPGVELETLTELENLARLPRPQFELKREDAAPRLDLPIETLDDEVANLRSQLVASTNGGQALALTQPHNSRAAEASRAVSYGGGAADSETPGSRQDHTTVRSAALNYYERGWRSTPLRPRTKIPMYEEWPTQRLEPDDIEREFVDGRNLGLLLGEPSGGLADVDLDCPEAVALAAHTLPQTGTIFGRAGSPSSHWLYQCSPPDFRITRFADPVNGATLLELRGTGGQTMAPPSIHPTGAQVEWEGEDTPTELPHAELLRRTGKLAAGSLLARHWPGGNRHQVALALAGALARVGWSEQDVDKFIFVVACVANDEEASSRRTDVRTTFQQLQKGGRTTGGPTCAKLFGEEVWSQAREWLGLHQPGEFRIDVSVNGRKEPPRPLYRAVPPGEEFPVDALGAFGASCARKIQEATGAPPPICAQSVLAAMVLGVTPHVDVELPTGEVKPTAEYLATIAATGERKSAADHRATAAFREYEAEQEEDYRDERFAWLNAVEAWDKARDEILKDKTKKDKVADLKALGQKPEAPITPMILVGADPTVEGLIRMFHDGGASVAGLFTDEGGAFIGGHAMSDDARLRSAATLSNLWDGAEVRRVRGGDGFYTIRGRRLAARILIQPDAAQLMFADKTLCDQGLLTRFLAVMPARAAGTRPFVKVADTSEITKFSTRVRELLDQPRRYKDNAHPRDGLTPALMKLSSDAEKVWIEFYDWVEAQLGPGNALDLVAGLANKAAEHAARLGAGVAYFDTKETVLNAVYMQYGTTLARYYLTEALRIRQAAIIHTDLEMARQVLDWLQQRWESTPKGLVSLPDIYQYCPHHAVHSKEVAAHIVKILVDHGWLEPAPVCEVNGVNRREVYQIIKEGE